MGISQKVNYRNFPFCWKNNFSFKIFYNWPNLKIIFSNLFFFDAKKKVSIFFGLLYRCEIFWRIHFSHPRSDLTSISGWNPLPNEKIMILSSKSEVWMADATLDDKSEFWMIFFAKFSKLFFSMKKKVWLFFEPSRPN